jgi:hypothetical protein
MKKSALGSEPLDESVDGVTQTSSRSIETAVLLRFCVFLEFIQGRIRFKAGDEASTLGSDRKLWAGKLGVLIKS